MDYAKKIALLLDQVSRGRSVLTVVYFLTTFKLKSVMHGMSKKRIGAFEEAR